MGTDLPFYLYSGFTLSSVSIGQELRFCLRQACSALETSTPCVQDDDGGGREKEGEGEGELEGEGENSDPFVSSNGDDKEGGVDLEKVSTSKSNEESTVAETFNFSIVGVIGIGAGVLVLFLCGSVSVFFCGRRAKQKGRAKGRAISTTANPAADLAIEMNGGPVLPDGWSSYTDPASGRQYFSDGTRVTWTLSETH